VAGNGVRARDERGQHEPGRLAEPQGGGEEAQGGAVVHGRGGDVEGEAGDGCVHEDAKVVAEVGAGYTKGVHGCQDEGVAGEEEGDGRVFDEWCEEGRVGGLGGERGVVAM